MRSVFAIAALAAFAAAICLSQDIDVTEDEVLDIAADFGFSAEDVEKAIKDCGEDCKDETTAAKYLVGI